MGGCDAISVPLPNLYMQTICPQICQPQCCLSQRLTVFSKYMHDQTAGGDGRSTLEWTEMCLPCWVWLGSCAFASSYLLYCAAMGAMSLQPHALGHKVSACRCCALQGTGLLRRLQALKQALREEMASAESVSREYLKELLALVEQTQAQLHARLGDAAAAAAAAKAT